VSEPNPTPPVTQIRTPEGKSAGVFANGMGVWFTATEFTLDFLISLPTEVAAGPDGASLVVAPQEVVSRVKIPPPLVFHIMRNMNAALDQYESQHGKIRDVLGGGFEPPPGQG
jgi:Protein of unknown function (DUF3467)